MLNYQILNFMSIGSLRRLKTLDTHPNFQFKLTQLFISPLSASIRFQSDFAIIAHGNDSTVNIYLCNKSYTSIQKSLTLQNVKSPEDLKVKYNHISGQILIAYRKKNEIQLIKTKIDDDKRISQSYSDFRLTMNEGYHCVPFQQQAHIINISDIVQTPDNKIYCLITVASGKVYMVSFINQKLQIHNTKQENRFLQYLKNITIRLKKQPLWSHKTCYTHSQVICHSQRNPYLYTLFLIDGQLYVKCFGQLGSRSREIDSWQLNQYENPLLGNCQIINCVFAPLQNQYEVELFVLCCVDQWKVVLYIMTINIKQKMKSVKTINNVFKNDQRMQSEDEPTLDYHKDLDHIDIEYFNDKIYLLLSKNSQANSLMRKKVHYLAEVSKHQSQWSYCEFQMLETSGGELRMIKTMRLPQIQNQQSQSLLFIGESNCYSFQTDIQSYEEQNNLERMLEMSQGKRTPPPIPKYSQKEREPTNTYVPTKSMPMAQNKKQEQHSYLDPFSDLKIKSYVEKKDYGNLFNFINMQKQQLYKQLSSINSGNLNSQSLKKHLFILVILKIFTLPKGLKPSLLIERIKQILTKFSENDTQFLPGIFVKKNVEALQRIFKYLLQSKQYKLLYQLCTETIPNFMQMLVQSYKKSTANKQQENNMQNESKSGSKLLPFGLFSEYLQLYQNLANVLPNKKMQEKQQFKEYQHKQFLDKYFYIQSLIEQRTEKQQKLMLQQNKKMIKSYIQNSDKMIKYFISFAIKYSNIGIFQYFVLQRFVTKQDMCQFVNQNQRHSQDSITRLFIDLINTEISFISNFKRKQHRGLYVLDWVPKQYQAPIFHFLRDHYPILALVYGLTIMPRRQLAKKLEQRLRDLEKFATAEQFLAVIGPLYSVACPKIKVNIDMALLLFEKNKKFISYDQITQRAFGVSAVPKRRWLQFLQKSSKYLNQQQVQLLKRNLKIND